MSEIDGFKAVVRKPKPERSTGQDRLPRMNISA